MRIPSLIRVASAAVGTTALALAIPAAASASTGSASHPMPPRAHCVSSASVGMKLGHKIDGSGMITCFRPNRHVPETVAVTLYRDGKAVAAARQTCARSGRVAMCMATTPAVKNKKGLQKWCAVSKASYGKFYSRTTRECLRA